jgi:uncharacterized spore protein YtfJ
MVTRARVSAIPGGKEMTMTTEHTASIDEVRQAVSAAPADRILERLAELIGARAGVQAVFGDPVERGHVTVIPVARVRWGFGGGAGTADAGTADTAASAPASGSGGGGGVAADPIGYLEIGPDGAEFHPISAPYPSPVFLLACGLTAAIVLRGLARLLRG